MMIKEIPISERPREKLLSFGVHNLSNSELLSIILKTGTKDKSVSEVSFDLLSKYSFNELSKITIEELMTIKGIGLVKAIEIITAIELGKRLFFKVDINLKKLCSAKDIFTYMKYKFHGLEQECFYALYFNTKQELIEEIRLFMGTNNRSVTHMRDVFREAYKLNASSIVVMHNHPSGDVTPSKSDIVFTNSLVKTGNIQGIPVIDHIVVGNDNFYSFYEHNNILN